MKKIEITLDIETGAYHIDEIFNDSYQQGLKTYDFDYALRYIKDLMEELNNENRQTIVGTK